MSIISVHLGCAMFIKEVVQMFSFHGEPKSFVTFAGLLKIPYQSAGIVGYKKLKQECLTRYLGSITIFGEFASIP